jgi:hypothetical protein
VKRFPTDLEAAVMSDDVARLHIELPDELHAKIKALAAERGQTLKGLVIVELRRVVKQAEREVDVAKGKDR